MTIAWETAAPAKMELKRTPWWNRSAVIDREDESYQKWSRIIGSRLWGTDAKQPAIPWYLGTNQLSLLPTCGWGFSSKHKPLRI